MTRAREPRCRVAPERDSDRPTTAPGQRGRGTGGPMRVMGGGLPPEKSLELHGRRPGDCSGCCARARPGRSLLAAGRDQRGPGGARRRSSSARRPTSSSPAWSAPSCPPASPRSRWSPQLRRRATTRSPTCSAAMRRGARPGHRLRRARLGSCCWRSSLVRRRPRCSGWLQGYLLARRGAAAWCFRLRERGRGQARPAAAALLRPAARGEVLSRATNDIDNIAQSLAADAEPDDHLAADHRRRARR